MQHDAAKSEEPGESTNHVRNPKPLLITAESKAGSCSDLGRWQRHHHHARLESVPELPCRGWHLIHWSRSHRSSLAMREPSRTQLKLILQPFRRSQSKVLSSGQQFSSCSTRALLVFSNFLEMKSFTPTGEAAVL